MKTIKFLSILCFFSLSINDATAQSKKETGSSSYYDFMDKNFTSIYGMKIYHKENTYYLFITDAFKICEITDTNKLDNNLEDYIEANYSKVVSGANKYLNYGGLNGYIHICYFYEKGNTSNSTLQLARAARTTAISEFQKDSYNPGYTDVEVIKISSSDFDFYLTCN